tara:strand:+ start:594 stop:794 length:201 start_codon:yes stop_codon:yes gene_type:complete
VIPAVLKLLTPSVVKAIMSYVFDKNELDDAVEKLEERVDALEKDSHPPRDFVLCKTCQNKIKEQKK